MQGIKIILYNNLLYNVSKCKNKYAIIFYTKQQHEISALCPAMLDCGGVIL